MVENPPANAGDIREAGWIPVLGRSPGEGNSNPLQYSDLENSIDCIVHGIAELDTTKLFHFHIESVDYFE